MRHAVVLGAAFVWLVIEPGRSRGDDLESRIDRVVEVTRAEHSKVGSVLITASKRALDRTRRGFSIGPFVGAAPGMGTENDGEMAFDVEFGIALIRYDIPVLPSTSRLSDIVLATLRDRLKQRVAAAIRRSENPDEAQVETWAEEIYRNIVDELLMKLRPRTFERPSLRAQISANRLLGEDAWNLRAGLGLGIGPVFLSAGGGVTVNSPVAGLGFVEISRPILISSGLRSPVVEPFVRFDASTRRDDGRSDHVLLGARFILDLI